MKVLSVSLPPSVLGGGVGRKMRPSAAPRSRNTVRIGNPRDGAGRCGWKRTHLWRRRRRCWYRRAMAMEEKSRRGRMGGDREESRRRVEVRRRRRNRVEASREMERDGECRPVSQGQAGFPAKTRLPQGRDTRVVGFQIHPRGGPWKTATWNSNAGKAGVPRRESCCQSSPN
jgi:hypothetical protein